MARAFIAASRMPGAVLRITAAQLRCALARICEDSGCAKVNVIAHSKGGLDVRFLAAQPACAQRVASITTLATPHHGSKTLDMIVSRAWLLLRLGAVFVNGIYRVTGDEASDFLAVLRQLRTSSMTSFNAQIGDQPHICYQHYAAALLSPSRHARNAFAYLIVRVVEGENDGLVTVASATYGGDDFKGVLCAPG
jgi:triacylglycerol lipase